MVLSVYAPVRVSMSDLVDVAGGYSPSMLDAVRRTLDTSKALTIQDTQYHTLTFEEVFRLATLGGSQGGRLVWRGVRWMGCYHCH